MDTPDTSTGHPDTGIDPTTRSVPKTADASTAADSAATDEHDGGGSSGGVHMRYKRFAAMIAVSTIVMFVLMYINTYAWDHVRWSETRLYMALLMGGAMAIIMLSFMLSMYKSTKMNIGIFVLAIATIAGSLALVRSQVTVQNSSWMAP